MQVNHMLRTTGKRLIFYMPECNKNIMLLNNIELKHKNFLLYC